MNQLLSTPDQLGHILAAARRAAGLTQSAAAARVGVSQARISAMELNPASIRADQLLALCAAYKLELVVQTKPGEADPQTPASDAAPW
jgi:HTH-type transcriptional regulator/antitoxin HipB